MSREADSAAGQAYMTARKAGADEATARSRSNEARRRVTAERRMAGGEFDRLRQERDALLAALAGAWGVTESEALRVVRLDIEETDR